jgi:hypothetical protein
MKSTGVRGIVAALLVSASVAQAGIVPQALQVGATYELTLVKDSAQHCSNGSGGTSHDQDTLIEQVTGLRADGLELQYDLPSTTTAEEGNFQLVYSSRLADRRSCSTGLNSTPGSTAG